MNTAEVLSQIKAVDRGLYDLIVELYRAGLIPGHRVLRQAKIKFNDAEVGRGNR